MQQATTTPANPPPFNLHRVTSTRYTIHDATTIHIQLEFSLDPLQLERQAGPEHAEAARRLIEHLTADLIAVQVANTPEDHAAYETGLRSRAARDQPPQDPDPAYHAPDPGHPFKLADLTPIWSEPGRPTHDQTHHTAYLPNPNTQAIELRTEGTRTHFRWSETFQANPAVEGLIQHLKQQQQAKPPHPAQDLANLQELTNTLAALTHFLAPLEGDAIPVPHQED